jgi:hypothetical protein
VTGRKSRDISILVCFAWCGTAAALAQEPDGLKGRVVDAAGAAVPGAKIWVIGGSWDEPASVAETTTDSQGSFSFPTVWKELKAAGAFKRLSHSFSLAARDNRGRFGWVTSIGRVAEPPSAIVLVEPGEACGRIVDRAGKPIAGAEIVPAIVTRPDAKRLSNDYLRIPPALAAPMATTTAADGSFTIRGIPAAAQIQARLSHREFGTPRVLWDSTKPVTITLDGRLGRIEGQLAVPDGKRLPAQLGLAIQRKHRADEPTDRSVQFLYMKTVSADADGRFRIDALPPGHYSISLASTPECGYNADLILDLDVGPNKVVTGVKIQLRRLVAVTGRIVDAASGEGIADVWLNARVLSGSPNDGDSDVTDARGRYTVHVVPGKIMIQPSSPPIGHLGLNYESVPQLDVTADREWPDLKLPRAAALDGIVVDAAGKPVEGAEIHALKIGAMGFIDSGPQVKSARDGSFRLQQLDPDDTLPVRARTKDATTDGAVVIEPGKQSGKLTLVVDPKFATRVHGVIRDRSGKPIGGAAVSLGWGRNVVSRKVRFSGVGSELERIQTDSEGRFASPALWPGDRYKVTVEAPGYGRAESPEITGRARDDHDFGAIRLVATGSRVEGRVLDTAAKSVADVTVFNRGDGPEAVTARTDASGNFLLEGLFDGGKYVFARKDGFRFTGMRVERDTGPVTLTLRRVDEAPPAWESANRAAPEDDKAIARRVLTKVWERYGDKANDNGAWGCIVHMARIDAPLALKWSGDAGGHNDDRVYQEAGENLAETDADEAIALFRTPRGGSGQHVLVKLAERFVGEDPAKALKFAELAVEKARAMDLPDRAGALAKSGALLMQLGRKQAGLALVNEGAEAATKMGVESREAYARGNVAGALAPVDVDRALALVEPNKNENDRDRYFGFIATALAATDPKRALTVAGKIGDRTSAPQSVKVAIAYALGLAGRTDEALQVIEGMKGHYAAEKFQSEAYAWLAVAVAPRDKTRAASLIDRALAMPVDQAQEFQSWTYFGGGPGEAGWTAVCAKRAGYPDMAGAVYRVLAARAADRYRDPSMDAECQTIAAAILALTDPKAASQMLRDLELRWGQPRHELGRTVGRRWLMAWALADPSHAEQLFENAFSALESERNVQLQSTGVFKMAEILVQPRQRREEFLRHEIGATWCPGIEQ